MHMNNSRYLRECDFGRFNLWVSTGVWDAIHRLKGSVTLGGNTIRFRRSLRLFDRYQIRSKVTFPFLALLDYVSRAHEIKIRSSSVVRPSVRPSVASIISEVIAWISFKF